MKGRSLRSKLKGIYRFEPFNKGIIGCYECSSIRPCTGSDIQRHKAGNILFTRNGVVKVADWGLAKVLFTFSSKSSAKFKGALIYFAPE